MKNYIGYVRLHFWNEKGFSYNVFTNDVTAAKIHMGKFFEFDGVSKSTDQRTEIMDGDNILEFNFERALIKNH